MQINCQERYDKEREFAKSIGLLKQFDETFERLRRKEDNEDCPMRVSVGSDWYEHCFSFCVEYMRNGEWQYYYNGGVIYHGCPKEGYRENGSFMEPGCYGWSIHT